jgi:hypothetical protein
MISIKEDYKLRYCLLGRRAFFCLEDGCSGFL